MLTLFRCLPGYRPMDLSVTKLWYICFAKLYRLLKVVACHIHCLIDSCIFLLQCCFLCIILNVDWWKATKSLFPKCFSTGFMLFWWTLDSWGPDNMLFSRTFQVLFSVCWEQCKEVWSCPRWLWNYGVPSDIALFKQNLVTVTVHYC